MANVLPNVPGTHAFHMKMLMPKPAASPDIPPPPVIEDADARRQDEADRLRMRKGRAASILTAGSTGVPMTAGKVLLGT